MENRKPLSNEYYRLPVKNPHLRAALDVRGIIDTDGRLELGATEAAISMNPDKAPMPSVLPFEVIMHQGLAKDLSDELLNVLGLAEEVGKLDQKTAEYMYEAIEKMAHAINRFSEPTVKQAFIERDEKRKTAYYEYWRSKQGKISRY